MLKKLKIRNFRNHKIKEIDFDKHVTILTGPNDSGKTAILGALVHVLFNRPAGRSFITHGRKQCVLQLFFDKRICKRVVGKNGYYSLDKKKFKAVGNKVPPEIASSLSVAEINLQSQHNQLFWFGLTPGQTAKELNKLVDLESIDRVQSLIAKKLRDKKAELAVAKKRLAAAKEDCTRFKPAKSLDVKLGKIETRQNDIARRIAHEQRISDLLKQAVLADATIETLANTAAVGRAAVSSGVSAVTVGERVETLSGLLAKLEQAETILQIPIPKLPELPKTTQYDKILKLVRLHEKNAQEITRLERLKKKARANLEKQLNGRCPTCGNLLTDKTLI